VASVFNPQVPLPAQHSSIKLMIESSTLGEELPGKRLGTRRAGRKVLGAFFLFPQTHQHVSGLQPDSIILAMVRAC
jgi:hypothetical protein